MIPDTNANYPTHIAIIMDGNNRWARARNLSGTAGHRQGAEAAKVIVNSCIARSIPYLTLFAFSSENWLRPKKEVQSLMALFLAILKRNEIQQMHDDNVRLQFIGNRASFSPRLQESMEKAEQLTAGNTGITISVAADYGGRWDIANAAREIANDAVSGNITAEQITTDLIQKHICLADIPAPDLCIRTGGERRISNFLLWQFAYTELYFTDCFWPDFDDAQLQIALDDYSQRVRRFGRHPEFSSPDRKNA